MTVGLSPTHSPVTQLLVERMEVFVFFNKEKKRKKITMQAVYLDS